MSYSAKTIDKCIENEIPVNIVGWEHLGDCIIKSYCFEANMLSIQINFTVIGKKHREYTVLVTEDSLPQAVIPTTPAGQVLFGYKE